VHRKQSVTPSSARTHELRDSHGGGTAPHYDEDQMEELRVLINERPKATAAALRRAMGAEAPFVSLRTMTRYRRQLGFTPRRGRIQQEPHPKDHEVRLAWAHEHRRAGVSRWLHSDESHLQMRDTGGIVWAPRGETAARPQVETLRCHLNIWGVVWDEGRIFAQYDGHLSGQGFVNLLKEHLLPERENLGDRPLLLDNAPCHRANIVRRWCEDNNIPVRFLPPRSPEFNAIEDCWAWLKQRVRADGPSDETDLRASMDAACDALPQAVIRAHLRHAQHCVRSYV
jgi:transposase